MNDSAIIVAAAVAAAGLVLAAAAALLLRALRELGALRRAGGDLESIQIQLDGLREQVRASLEGGRLELDRRLEETNRVVGDIRRGLGEVDRQVRTVGDTARELRGLQELLRAPKIRGEIGETLLGELLAQMLPTEAFELQFPFPSGERVDAIVRLGGRIVPVDAKFPLENFQRVRQADEADLHAARRAFSLDVKRHVDAIASRYVRPGDGTYDFALMYLPAEAVYQELLGHDGSAGSADLLHYALTRKVVPVSPQSFYAYLQVIVLGLRGLAVEGRAGEIVEHLGEVRTRLGRFSEAFETASRHVANAQKQTDEAGRRLARLGDALDAIDAASVTPAGAVPAPDDPLERVP